MLKKIFGYLSHDIGIDLGTANTLVYVKGKGIIIDTNGTINPSNKLINILHRKNVMVRVSWDSIHPLRESQLREYPKGMYKNNVEYLDKKQDVISVKWIPLY